jgi:hypothetical protein
VAYQTLKSVRIFCRLTTSHSAGGRDDRVYVTTDLLQAICRALVNDGDVYLVRPIGRLGPDEDGHYWPNYTVRCALIVNRVSLPSRMIGFRYAHFHQFHRDLVDLHFALTGR